MKIQEQKLTINSLTGGNGDIWMRLISLYIIASLQPNLEIHILIPKFLRPLARYTFGDRLFILEDSISVPAVCYTSLGIRHLIKGLVKGNRYIAPYHRSVIHDKNNLRIRDLVNIVAFNIANTLNLIQVPAWKWISSYQGYLDVIGLKVFKKITYQQFNEQLHIDFEQIYARLNDNIPISPELSFPFDLKDNIIIFPTGTSRQFIPTWWALTYLPNAYYAFYFKDKEAKKFESLGLKTIYFYNEPGDIIKLSKQAKWTISTDSFPSHLLQYATKKCTITITEVMSSRIISPVFKGSVINAVAKCHPCLHLAKDIHPMCSAGFTECINWKNKTYTNNILRSIPVDLIKK